MNRVSRQISISGVQFTAFSILMMLADTRNQANSTVQLKLGISFVQTFPQYVLPSRHD